MKKTVSLFLTLVILIISMPLLNTKAETTTNNTIKIGDCIILGTYYEEPIVWRCVDIDENGPLMLSDKILCIKAFDVSGNDNFYHSDGWGYIRKGEGSNCWEDSNLRQWLNSYEDTVSWTHCPPIANGTYNGLNEYADEPGFLSNFSEQERKGIKQVTQTVNVNIWETKRSGYCDGGHSDTIVKQITSPSLNCYDYYYKNIVDSIFVLSAYQYNRIYNNNPQYLIAYPTEQAVNNSNYKNSDLNPEKPYLYWTNIPRGNNYACYEHVLYVEQNGKVTNHVARSDSIGVRPAFYLSDEWNGNIYDENLLIEPFSTYFANYLKDYWEDMSYVSMPCKKIIANGGMGSLVWDTVLQSIKSLGDFKLGIDEKGYYEAILLDLLTNNVTSVNYDKEITQSTLDMAKKLSDFLIDKGVDISKENLDNADLENMWGSLQSYLLASDIKITKEAYDALLDGGVATADCLEKISTYAIAMEESQHLIRALNLMAQCSDYQVLTDALNQLSELMTSTPEEMCKYVSKKEVGGKTSKVVGDFLLSTIKKVFPFETIKDIVDIAEWGSNLVFPVSITSEQKYRIYTLNHIENISRASFKTAYNNYLAEDTVENAENVVSCFDMFVRVYEHEIAECNALAELLYKKGFLNGIENFFSTNNMDDYQSAVDWVNSYNVNLDKIKGYKEAAYLERGINSGILKVVRFIGVVDGKIAGHTLQAVDTGSNVAIPDFSKLNTSKYFMNKALQNCGVFEGWYYDEECTKPSMATSITVNKHTVLYAKFSMKTGKQLQVKCPVNVEIYDNFGNLCLKIEDNQVVHNSADLSVNIIDSQKNIFLPYDQEYSIKLSATQNGTMNYSVTEVENGVSTNKINTYDIPLYKSQKFEGSILEGLDLSESSYSLHTATKNGTNITISPDESISTKEMQNIDITINALGNGETSNGLLATKGDYVLVEAIPNENEEFVGWYAGNILLSTDLRYGFIAKESKFLTAVFTPYKTPSPTVKLIGSSRLILTAIDNYKYSIDGINWQTNNIFTGLKKGETYTVFMRNCDAIGEINIYDMSVSIEMCDEDGLFKLDAFEISKICKTLLNNENSLSADINGDSQINVIDLVRAKRIAAGICTNVYGDINQDGKFDILDIKRLSSYLNASIENIECYFADINGDTVIDNKDLYELISVI